MSYTKKFVELYKAGKIDDTTITKMAIFKEEVKEFIKTANPITRGQLLAAAGVSALVSAGAGVAETMVEGYLSDKAKQETEEKANEVFEKIYEESEIINKNDKEKARQFFRSIVHFSPHVATDPLAAESYLTNLLYFSKREDAPLPTPIIKELAEVEDRSVKSLDKRYSAAGVGEMLFEPIKKAITTEPKNLFTSYSAAGTSDYSEHLHGDEASDINRYEELAKKYKIND